MSLPDAPLVVVIDDDDPFLALMQDLLVGEGYRVITGTIARDVIRLIEGTHPALLILDLVMETQEAGLELLRELRVAPATVHLPVLLCTANHQFVERRGSEVRALDAQIILKPFMLADMLDAITNLAQRPV